MKARHHRMPSVPFPVPLGAQVGRDGVQFTVFSRHATRVWLLLFDAPDAAQPDQEYELTPERHRIGDLWHIHVPAARPGQFYLYRMAGQAPAGRRNFFHPDQWLLDPYALAVAGAPQWGDTAWFRPGVYPQNGARFPKGVIISDEFDRSGDRTLRTPLGETVIYEAHLRGFTAHRSSGARHRGTFAAFIEKLPYLRDLGVTAVELLPIQEFNEMEFYQEDMGRRGLRNLWGYSTVAFFAPNGRYAHGGVRGQQVREFKELVLALHQAGLEVILDVAFNHTAEQGAAGPAYSFRGLDNDIYYLMDERTGAYSNFSGCGNTVNSNHPIVRDFIMDCLRYWVLHMRVDGFRFDLASVLTRGPDGRILPNPPIVEHIAEDPALRDAKILAEAWDAAGAYQVGAFPHERWCEWNGRYRDDVRRFWHGAPGQLGALATRLAGSSDLYSCNGCTPLKSINFVTCHDGFALADLVSYNEKHNAANGEDNRDGDGQNFSCNHGVEGPADDPALNALRLRQQKNFLLTLLVSQGVPMLLAGDEFGRTQGGNNNAYAQDNETSWIDWTLLREQAGLHDVVRRLIAFRRAHPALRRHTFLSGTPPDAAPAPGADVRWLGPDGAAPDWEHGAALGCLLRGDRACTGAAEDDDNLLLLFNGGGAPATFTLPAAPGAPWRLAFATEEPPPACDAGAPLLTLTDCAAAVLVSDRR
ncbi:MAG: glycogen debranching protein GlgX [Kiritimatiellaeota bacterium]|nr:glycogen debranching protein GlgX [Kiritimatiellota bacterium]